MEWVSRTPEGDWPVEGAGRSVSTKLASHARAVGEGSRCCRTVAFADSASTTKEGCDDSGDRSYRLYMGYQ